LFDIIKSKEKEENIEEKKNWFQEKKNWLLKAFNKKDS
jgi:hypothetical protein